LPEAKTETTTLRWQPSLRKKVDTAARKAGISRNKLIEVVLLDFMDERSIKDIRDLVLADEQRGQADAAPDLFA
jgi:hypothetical protein